MADMLLIKEIILNHPVNRLLKIVGLSLLLMTISFFNSYAQKGETSSTTTYPNCRFGVTTGSDFTKFDINDLNSLNAGWYVNWKTVNSPGEPAGIQHVNIIRLQPEGNSYTSTPSASILTTQVTANPGQTWFIGNEPDRAEYQDDLYATIYADAYHDLYYLIKQADPTAQVGIGGVVQPTPLRLMYLDIVWDTYRSKYGESMPVDIWNIHSFILQEDRNDYGASIPPGPEFLSINTGMLYNLRDSDNLTIFWDRIVDFRKWMAQHGQRDKPLVITEYGVLYPEDYSDEDGILFSQERVGRFMRGGFDLMLNTTNAGIGYPYDGNRLVQRWAWFSVDGETFMWGGSLFDNTSGTIRDLGKTYRNYTTALSPVVSLDVPSITTTPVVEWVAPVTFTLMANIANSGNIASTKPVTVTFYEGTPENQGMLIDAPQIIPAGLGGCGNYATAKVTWTNVLTGANHFFVRVQSTDDSSIHAHAFEGVALVATSRTYLPVIFRQ